MDLSDLALNPGWALLGWAAALAVLVTTLARAHWKLLVAGPAVHVVPAIVFALCLLWALRASIGGALAFHLLGTAALALTAGAPLALVGGAIVVGAMTFVRDAPVLNAGIVWLTTVAIPVAIATGVLRLVERRLPANFFVYVFAACFAGAALAFGAGGIASAAAAVTAGGLHAEVVFGDYAPFLLHLAFGEAMLTGALLTLAVVYRPHWVATFDDRRYLSGK
jgi:uncharacterized membrane protein